MPQPVTMNDAVLGGGRLMFQQPLPFLLSLTLATSSVVMFEPAPCDVLFAITLIVGLLMGYSPYPSRLGLGLNLGIFVFVIANLLSLMFADSVRTGVAFFGVTAYLIVYFLFFVELVSRHGQPVVDLMLKWFVFAALVTVLIAVLATLRWIPHSEIFFRDIYQTRVQSTFKDPNVFAPFLVAAATVVLGDLIEGRKHYIRNLLVFSFFVGGVLIALSRGAYFHFAITLFIYGALHLLVIRDSKATAKFVVAGAFLAIAGVPVAGWLLSEMDLADIFYGRLSFQEYDNVRFGTQADAVEAAWERPFGIGPGHVITAYFGQAAHSTYVRIFAENGLLGLFGFLIFIASWFRICWGQIYSRGPNANLCAVCLAVVTGVLAESVVIDTLHWRHLFLFMSFPVGLWIYERTNGESA